MSNPTTDVGLFLPTTPLIDTQAIYDNENLHIDIKNILIRMNENFNDIYSAVNLKDTGIYNLQEFVTGAVFFPNPALSSATGQTPVRRQVFRLVVNFGALPNTANKAVAHGVTLTANTFFTTIYATATDTTGLTALPIPLVFTATGNTIDLRVDATNVNIQTNFNATNYNNCLVILEYIKQ